MRRAPSADENFEHRIMLKCSRADIELLAASRILVESRRSSAILEILSVNSFQLCYMRL